MPSAKVAGNTIPQPRMHGCRMPGYMDPRMHGMHWDAQIGCTGCTPKLNLEFQFFKLPKFRWNFRRMSLCRVIAHIGQCKKCRNDLEELVVRVLDAVLEDGTQTDGNDDAGSDTESTEEYCDEHDQEGTGSLLQVSQKPGA